MPVSNYYTDATNLIEAYLTCDPEKRIEFVRENIGSEETELDLNKVYKAVDAILLTVEKARGQLASQLALASCQTAPRMQLMLFPLRQIKRETVDMTPQEGVMVTPGEAAL